MTPARRRGAATATAIVRVDPPVVDVFDHDDAIGGSEKSPQRRTLSRRWQRSRPQNPPTSWPMMSQQRRRQHDRRAEERAEVCRRARSRGLEPAADAAGRARTADSRRCATGDRRKCPSSSAPEAQTVRARDPHRVRSLPERLLKERRMRGIRQPSSSLRETVVLDGNGDLPVLFAQLDQPLPGAPNPEEDVRVHHAVADKWPPEAVGEINWRAFCRPRGRSAAR